MPLIYPVISLNMQHSSNNPLKSDTEISDRNGKADSTKNGRNIVMILLSGHWSLTVRNKILETD